MQIRDRVKELRRVRADLLRPHPKNWRTHPDRQRDALRGVLAEIGYADALLVRELPDGALELIDGHLRAETTPEAEVPVLVLDLTDDEAAKLLAVLDPLAALAGTDRSALAGLLETVETQNEAVGNLLDELLGEHRRADLPEPPAAEINLPEAFQIVVECRDEADQRALFERLRDEGYECKLLSL
ncbi:MAG: ParB N-terminal domain-containing protein [Pirellulaceae bacterium]|nr:ParB N-terminal domain-containing protein [Pirellulaceae bacterium]